MGSETMRVVSVDTGLGGTLLFAASLGSLGTAADLAAVPRPYRFPELRAVLFAVCLGGTGAEGGVNLGTAAAG